MLPHRAAHRCGEVQGCQGLGWLWHPVWREAGWEEAAPDHGAGSMSDECILSESSVPQATGRQYVWATRLPWAMWKYKAWSMLISFRAGRAQRLRAQSLEPDARISVLVPSLMRCVTLDKVLALFEVTLCACCFRLQRGDDGTYLTVLVSKLYSSSSNRTPVSLWEKTSDTPWLRDILQSIWPVLFKTVKVIENRESLRSCYNQEESRETWWLNITQVSNLHGILRQRTLEKKMRKSE